MAPIGTKDNYRRHYHNNNNNNNNAEHPRCVPSRSSALLFTHYLHLLAMIDGRGVVLL